MIEVRDLEKRLVAGRIIPYGEEIQVKGRPESFAKGAVADVDITRVKLLDHHERAIGRGVSMEEREDGAYAEFKVSRTMAGDEMLELAADGVVDSFSPGFLVGEQDAKGVHRRLAALPEVSLVTFPAYRSAQVLSVRNKEDQMTDVRQEEEKEIRVEEWSALEARMDAVNAHLERIQTSLDAPGGGPRIHAPTALDWFRGEVDALDGKLERRSALETKWEEIQTRALEDITGVFPEVDPAVDLSALVIQEFIASQVVNVLDTRRPLFSRLGSFPMPKSGYARIPVVTQHTEVGPRTGQKDPANTRKMIVETQPFEAQWYDGAVDIALEIIRTAEIGVLEFVWSDLLGQYAIATEAGTVAEVNAGAFPATGAPLPVDTYKNFAKAVAEAAIDVRKGSGSPATLLAVTEAQWVDLISMVDASDRRQFATVGGTNADASAAINAESFTMPGGITVFYVPGLTNAVLTNGESLKVADGGPERVEAVNVELMGKDLGLLGRAMFVARIPAGVQVFKAATP